jgi:hypothetical protein
VNKPKSKKYIIIALTLLLTLLLSLTACSNTNELSNNANTPTPIYHESTNEASNTVPQETTSDSTLEKPKKNADESDTEKSVPLDEFIESNIVQRVLQELTKSEYNGRLSGSAEIVQAAHYLAGVFEKVGLLPWNTGAFILEYSNSDPGIRTFGWEHLSNAKGYNVVGVIQGKDRAKALVISAHYDAIGDGQGALDNASGVAAMLRVAENLLCWGEQPEVDIIFVAYDGEEIGLAGSQAFVLNVKGVYQEIFNINIDTIGLSEFPLSLVGDEKSISLREDITEFINDKGIPSENLLGTLIFGSDDVSFRNHGFSAITIGQFDNAFLIMHTENDVLDVLDFMFIENIADVLTEFIIELRGMLY